jgi:predicted metal-dependent hydrolase
MDADTISLDIEQKILKLPKTKSEQRLVEWLKTSAERIFGVIAKRFSQQMSVQYKSLSVTSARTRWGSCSGENRLCFTFRLLFAPKEIVEYVVVHELAHIRHKNHSAKFWSEVEKYQPDWKNKRAWLKAHGGLMELF